MQLKGLPNICGSFCIIAFSAWIHRLEKEDDQKTTPWCLGGKGGMDYRDYFGGLYRDYYGDPFPHSRRSTREKR